MSNKVIQIPIEEGLIEALDAASQSQKRSRADLIRQACRDYLNRQRIEELDRIYEQGYKRVPEDASIGEAQLELSIDVLGENSCATLESHLTTLSQSRMIEVRDAIIFALDLS